MIRLFASAAVLFALAAAPVRADELSDAFAASAEDDCARAVPLFESVLAEPATGIREIDASHGLALCLASGPEPWKAREIMATILPKVLAQYGPASPGLARHHSLWSEIEVRSGALNVAWRRSEAAIAALRSAGRVDPYDLAAEIYRLAAIQAAREQGDAFLAFLGQQMESAAKIDWAAPGDGELFRQSIGTPPSRGAPEALKAWAHAGIESLDPRPVYLALVG